jgi:hypothetical protein
MRPDQEQTTGVPALLLWRDSQVWQVLLDGLDGQVWKLQVEGRWHTFRPSGEVVGGFEVWAEWVDEP